jgi:hypothetical protein
VLIDRHGGEGRGLTIERIDGEAAADSPRRTTLVDAEFVAGYRGLTYRARQHAGSHA